MAKDHPTTSPPVIPSLGGPENVSSDVGASRAGINRRQAMTAMTAIAAAPAITFPSAANVLQMPDRCTWDRAVGHLRDVEAEYTRIDASHTAAFDAAEADCPYQPEFFRRYNLGCGQSRERNLEAAHYALVNEWVREHGRSLTSRFTHGEASEASACRKEAEQIVDDFDVWNKARDEAHERHNTDEWEKRFEVALNERENARSTLVATPAPDEQALLFKVELLAGIMREAAVEDADSIALVSNDARRLLSLGRA